MNTILAIQPESRQIGYAVFEGVNLVDWGSKDLTSKPIEERNPPLGIALLEQLVDRWDPDVVVLPKGTKKPGSVHNRLLKAIKAEVRRHPFVLAIYEWSEIRASFKGFIKAKRLNKHGIMETIAGWFPELQGVLPQPRGRSKTEDFRAPMFDAVALSVTYLLNL